MISEKFGRVVKGLGGLFEVRLTDGERISCRAKGSLKRDEEKVLIGDAVAVEIDDSIPDGVVISSVQPRKNSLIRPPMANLDYIFIVFAAKKPSPVIETVDKLSAIAVHNGIVPIAVITKSDLDSKCAKEYLRIYERAGIRAFVTSSENNEGISELSEFITNTVKSGATAAFAGASGVGKSTLMNALFPTLALKTQTISAKIERGRHTTRHVEIFDITEDGDTGFLADTPGFSLIDFERFDFFGIDELLPAFPDLLPYAASCRYTDCAHVGESSAECAIAKAVEDGAIEASRLESYRTIYKTLKSKALY